MTTIRDLPIDRTPSIWITADGAVGIYGATSPYHVAELILADEELYKTVTRDDEYPNLAPIFTAPELLVYLADRIELYRVPGSLWASARDEIPEERTTPWTWSRKPGSGYVLIAWVRA